MFIERLAGVFLYALSVLFVYFKIANNSHPKRTLSIYLIVLTSMAFFYVPGKQADLTRLLDIGNVNWRNVEFSYFLKNIAFKSSTPIGDLIIYIFTRTKFDGLLPAFCAFVFYSNVFAIFKRLLANPHLSRRSIALSFLLFMSAGSFLEVISDVRCFVAFSITTRIIYFEFLDKKIHIIDIFGFIIACLIHSTSIPLVMMWISFFLFTGSRRTNIKNTFINFMLICLFVMLVIFYGGRYIKSSVAKAENFFKNEIYSYFWEYLIGFIEIIVFTLVLIDKKKNSLHTQDDDLLNFCIIILLFVFAFSWEYNIFHRYLLPLSILMIPMLSTLVGSKKPIFRFIGPSIKSNIFYLSLLILFIACIRGNLCGYKFFIL